MNTGREKKFKMTVPLSIEEKENVKARAKDAGLTMSSYIRMCIRNFHEDDDSRNEKIKTIKLKDFAQAIGVSLSRARKICLEHQIAYYMIDEEYRIGLEDVTNYLESVKSERKVIEEATEPLLKIHEVARRYNVTPATVDSWIRNGSMPCVRIGPDGKRVRIRMQDVDCMMSQYGINEIQA
jgi:excisionase family DNA binding protein